MTGSVGPAGSAVSIHTPARGVTHQRGEAQTLLEVSIHTPARGVTCDNLPHAALHRVSIHTPARGVTVLSETQDARGMFQSTRPRGA